MKTYGTFFARLVALMLAVLTVLSLAACSGVGTLEPNAEGEYVNDKTGVVYHVAPDYYTVTSYLSDKAVALNDGVNFYAVEGVEDEKWLYSPDFGILLYAEGETLPTLADLQPTVMDVRLEEDGLMKTAFEIGNAEKISAVLDAYENGDTTDYTGVRANYTFYLEFTSATYPWLVYNLMFVQYAEDLIVHGVDESGENVRLNYGRNFLYNRYEDRFVRIGDEMQEYIDEYYHNTDAE